MNILMRLLIVPFVIAAVAWVFLVPAMIIVIYEDPVAENIFLLMFVAGLYPMILAVVHAARIEHFLVRSIDSELESPAADMLGPQFRQIWRAGSLLSRELKSRRDYIDTNVLLKGERLLRQYRVLLRLIWPGALVTVLGGLGLYLSQT